MDSTQNGQHMLRENDRNPPFVGDSRFLGGHEKKSAFLISL